MQSAAQAVGSVPGQASTKAMEGKVSVVLQPHWDSQQQPQGMGSTFMLSNEEPESKGLTSTLCG